MTNGTTYTFTVAAVNGIGTGSQSAESNPVTPKANQTITVTTHAPVVGGFRLELFGCGVGAGRCGRFSSSGACSNSGSTFTMTSGTGTCSVRYDQAGSATFNAAPQVVEAVSAQKADQTIAVSSHAPSSAVFGSSFSVAATAPGGAVVFSSSGACSNSGATFTMTSGTGTCSVRYDQAGSANYNAAPQVVEAVSAQKADQTITVSTHAPSSAVFGSSFSVAATAPGGAVDVLELGCVLELGATFTMTSGTGTCSVRYDQAGSANYNAAPQVVEAVSAQKADQTITVSTHAPSSAVFGSSFSVAASAPGGVVAFSSSGACSNSGSTFTMTSGTGTCSVRYDQAGSANYNAAPQVVEAVSAQKADQTIAVSTHAPASAVFGTSFPLRRRRRAVRSPSRARVRARTRARRSR